jgi:hypothetical protein
MPTQPKRTSRYSVALLALSLAMIAHGADVRPLTENEKKMYAGLAEKPDIEALAAKVPLWDAPWTMDGRPRPCIYFPEGVKTVRGLYIAPTTTKMDPRDAMRRVVSLVGVRS